MALSGLFKQPRRMSAFRRKADSLLCSSTCPLMTQSGHSPREGRPVRENPPHRLMARGHRRSRSALLATTVVWGPDYLVLRVSIRTLAVGPDEAGFWPVINNPSVTTCTPQFLTLEKVAPRSSSSSSTRKGTTLVRPTSASSPSVKPVTFFPSTSGLPAAVLT